MRLLLGLLMLCATAAADLSLPDPQVHREAPRSVIYIAEGAGGIAGAAVATLPAVAYVAIRLGSIEPDSTNLFRAILYTAVIGFEGMLVGAACAPFGFAAGVAAVGRELDEEGTFAGALAGTVLGSGVCFGLALAANRIHSSDDIAVEVARSALVATGILAIPVGGVAGYNLIRGPRQSEFGIKAERLALPAIESYAAATESGAFVPGVRAQLVTVRF
jgi:hypothetical protein